MQEKRSIKEENREEGSLPLEEVERVVDLLRESGVGEIQIRQGETEITVKAMPRAPAVAPQDFAQTAPGAQTPAPDGSRENSPDGLHTVRSPLVGTFYRASAPGEEPYVEVGDKVEAGQTLCLVEAMKLMNEIPADTSGEVVEILAEDSGGVEYDQPLFHLRPEG